jgi:3-oxoacyl-[acyl-carrier protein] reductase
VSAGFDLSGRVSVVTGAASGIGRASAVMLARAGSSVVCADLEEAGAEETAASIEASGGGAVARRVDVSSRAEVVSMVDDAVARYGRLDVMCNIAGVIGLGPVVDITEEELDRVFATNLKGVFFGCQAAARVMMEQGSGSIISTSSAAIDTPTANLVCYAMSKAGVAQLTKTLAVEAGPRGVRVNAIAPGFVITGMTSRHFVRADGSIDEAARDATVKPMAAGSPLGIVGEPDDIAYAVLYLAGDASKFVTGQILRPNGGVAMPW